jgi:hypothetical protein
MYKRVREVLNDQSIVYEMRLEKSREVLRGFGSHS